MKKKILSFFLLALLLINSSSLVGAEENTSRLFKVQYLIDNDIVEGRPGDIEGQVDYALDKNITRAELSKMLVHLLDLEDMAKALDGTASVFSDVPSSHWAAGYINVLTSSNSISNTERRLILGFPDGRFLPERDISYEELATILVRVNKEDLTSEDEKNAIWPGSYLLWAKELGIFQDISYSDSKKRVTREEAFVMIYNAKEGLLIEEKKVDFGNRLAIVSKYQAGVLEVNQDGDKLYKIDENTVFANASKGFDFFPYEDFTGSLINFIADQDGHVETIMELGNPRDLALGDSWPDLGQKLVSAKTNSFFTDNYTGSYEITVAGIKAEITKDSLLFAADKDNNILGPIKDLGQVFEEYMVNRLPLENVYMAYSEYDGYNEANVLVFNKVDKYQGKEELRRILSPVASNFRFTAESMIEGKEKVFDLSEAGVFPGSLDLDYMDVILMNFDSYESGKLTKAPRKLIDYEDDPVYKVHAYDGRSLVLRDQYNKELPLPLGQTAIFSPGQLKEGDHVQALILPPGFLMQLAGQVPAPDLDLTAFKVVAVSIVPDDLRGSLQFGYRADKKTAFVKQVNPMEGTVLVEQREDGVAYKQELYKFSSEDRGKLMMAKNMGIEISFDQRQIPWQLPEIYNVDLKMDYVALFKLPRYQLEGLLTGAGIDGSHLLKLYDTINNPYSGLSPRQKEEIINLLPIIMN
ncbi:MAG: S-layer homology domain-containing protein [Bacillota bacterium]|nr:S-layer homology domain-containing protein [Bacillota bacterium]